MEKKKNESAFYGILAAALLAVAGAGWLYFSKTRSVPAPAETETVKDLSWLSDLEGNYSMRESSGGDVTYSSATFRKGSEGGYEIVQVTVYGPVVYPVQLFEDGALLSEALGAGFAAYDPALGRYTLRFEKDNTVCELSR